MKYTGNYNLKKPEGSDVVNIEDLNDNADIIDQALKAHDDALDAHMSDGTQHAKTVRFVIGTSTAGWTAADCDYLCDGTNDQEEINNAINALPATGGEIVILDGIYNITGRINVNKNNVSIRGSGNASVLKRMWDSSSGEGVITLTSVQGCRIENLQIDGNKATYTSSYNYAIRLNSSSSNNTVTNNTCNNSYHGIFLSSSSNNNTITGNTCNNNEHGIRLESSSNNMVTGNTCSNNNISGIRLDSSSNNTVTGNICNNNIISGIFLYSSSNNNTITGNTCIRGTGTPGDYTTDQYTIRLSGTDNNYNLIVSNNCMGKAPVVQGGTGNSVFNNKWDASDDIQNIEEQINTAETNAKNHANSLIGTLSNLLTTAKNNVVAAINEIFGKLVGTKLALGQGASAEGNYSVALGYNTSVAGLSSVALGRNASAAEDYSVALGDRASAAGHYSVALGDHASATGNYSVALGHYTSAAEDYSVALGSYSSATHYCVTLGDNASATGNYSVALGYYALAQNNNEGILGGDLNYHTSKWKVPGSFTVSGTKNFEIPHPKPEKKATHVIRHGAVESPTPGDTLYRWKIQATKDNDLVTIDLPDYFVWLNKDVQIWVTGQGHFGNGYGTLNRETEQLEIYCQFEGEYNVLVIGTRNDDHESVQNWDIKGVEREIGESWTGETYVFSVNEILEVEEIKEVSA